MQSRFKVALTLFCIAIGGVARADDPLSICGQKPAGWTFDGIPAYYLCPGVPNIWSTDGVNTNARQQGKQTLKWSDGYQCVELAGRYTWFRWHKDLWQINGADMYCSPPSNPWNGVSVHREASYRPSPGDLMVWTAPYHVAIVNVVKDGRVVEIVQENVGRSTGNAPPRPGPLCFVHLEGGVSGAPSPSAASVSTWRGCNDSSYNGKQLWTCSSDGDLHRCDDRGAPQKRSCGGNMCRNAGLGHDDSCYDSQGPPHQPPPPPSSPSPAPAPAPVAAWDCNKSDYRGAQLWTCSGDGDLHRCEGGAARMITCRDGCRNNGLGKNDGCNTDSPPHTAPPPPAPAPPAPAPAPPSGPVHDTLHPGEELLRGQSITSSDGRYTLAMQGDGNLVLYHNPGRALWATNTNGRAATKLIMQADGNLVLYGDDGHVYWCSATHRLPGSANAHLIVQTDGNLVMYRAAGGALWATGTRGR